MLMPAATSAATEAVNNKVGSDPDTGEMECDADGHGTGCLTEESSRRKHSSRRARARLGCGADDGAVVGGLEKPETKAAYSHPPSNVEIVGSCAEK